MGRQRSLTAFLLSLGLVLVACTDGGGGPGLSFVDAGGRDVSGAWDGGDGGSGSDLTGPDLFAGPDYVAAPAALANQLQLLLDEYLLFTGEQNASLTVLLPDRVRWHGVSGVQDLQTGTPIAPGAAFRVGSSTKPVIAALSLLLQEDGLLDLDDPLGVYVTDYEAWADITLRQLLSMRSGITDYLVDQTLWLELVQHPDEPMSPDRLLGYVSSFPLQFEPGSQCLYSNTNYVLMGLVIEAATGNTVAEEIQARIAEPLALEHTYLDVDADEDPLLAHGYMDPRPAFSELGVPPELVGLIPAELFVDDNILDCAYLFHPSIAWSAGALVTTTGDMARFMRAFMGGELVQADSLAQVMDFPACTILGAPAEYGLGISRYDTPDGEGLGHGGLIYGYTSSVVHVSEAGLTYAHQHGAYPAQTFGFSSAVHRIVNDPEGALPEACVFPEGFFAREEEDEHLEVRLRGPLNASGDSEASASIGNLTAWLGGKRYPAYGKVTVASLLPGLAGERVQVFSLGPPRFGGYAYTIGMLNLDVSAIADGLSEAGVYEALGRSYALFSIVADMNVDETTGAMNRYCVAAVPVASANSRLALCEGAAMDWEEGALLRVFLDVPMTTDEEAIAAYLSPLSLGPCNCLNAEGTWEACDEGATKHSAEERPLAPVRDWMPPRLPARFW